MKKMSLLFVLTLVFSVGISNVKATDKVGANEFNVANNVGNNKLDTTNNAGGNGFGIMNKITAKITSTSTSVSTSTKNNTKLIASLKKQIKKKVENGNNKTKDDNNKYENQIKEINGRAKKLVDNKLDEILSELKIKRNITKEKQSRAKYLKLLINNVSSTTEEMQSTINNFITYGVDKNTEQLGEGERAGVLNSYKSTFGKLPTNDSEWSDVIKIADGRWPSQINKKAEDKAKELFKQIYLRDADMNNKNDNAAVTIMAYGLRPSKRNLNSESAGIRSFKAIFHHNPSSAEDWDIVRAIAYSGATR